MSLFNRNAPVIDSNIRILHAVPMATAIDIYVNGNLIARNVSFSQLTKYSALPAGSYQFQLYAACTYDKPLLSQDIAITHGSNYTISVVTLQDNLYLFNISFDNGNFYTIYIIGLFNDTPKLGYLLTVDYQ